jgi:hypothetical protein
VLHLGRLWPFPENIRPDKKGLQRTNTLAYYGNPSFTAVKSFIVQAPGFAIVKRFFFVIDCDTNKLECWQLTIFLV